LSDPARYHAWYDTPRGAWIGAREIDVLMGLLQPRPGQSILDVGCGSGYFSQAFAARGLAVIGLDPNMLALAFARGHTPALAVVAGSAESLPFADGAFDHAAAIASLCFVADPARALRELWRVSRNSVLLGLLHRRGLLYLAKGLGSGRGSYRGARWDLLQEVVSWTGGFDPPPEILARWAIYLPSAGRLARLTEAAIPHMLPLGSFLAVRLCRPATAALRR
jgi:SAM-dependent methyltransferase